MISLVNHIVICGALLLVLFSNESYGQEKPSFTTRPFDTSVSHRQNVCDRQTLLHNGTVELRDALDGFVLRPVLAAGPFFSLNEGGIDPDQPGLQVELLDEVARRSGFTWRNSYGLVDSYVLDEGRTYAELLLWSVETFDMAAAEWSRSISRIGLGVSFPEGWYDGSIIMVGINSQDESDFSFVSFLQPFAATVWVMIVVTIVVSGLVYWGLERFNTKTDDKELENDPIQSVFLAAISFTGQFEFRPFTNAARLFTFSLAFWSLLVASAYTANLASFLVVQNTPSLQLNAVGDAVRANLPMCVVGSSNADEAVSSVYPGAKLIRKKEEKEIYLGVTAGECVVAITTVNSWELYEGDRSVNGDCKMGWIGRVFKFVPAGFTTISDSGTLCTSLIRDVLNLHMLEMKEDGFVDRAWHKYLEQNADINCNASVDTKDDESTQLSLKDMGGLFIFHFGLTAVAICMAVIGKRYGKWKRDHATLPGNRKLSSRKLPELRSDSSNQAGDSNDGLAEKGGSSDDVVGGEDLQAQFESMYKKQTEQMAAIISMTKTMQSDFDAIRARVQQSETAP